MKLVVTGANGLIGRHFIKHYSDKYEIIGLSRHQNARFVSQSLISWRYTDYSLNSLEEIFSEVDAILHLASVRPNSKGDCLVDNLALDNTIFKAAQKSGVHNITYISSRSVYGDNPTPWSESDPLNLKTDYALSKHLSETVAKYYNDNSELKIKILRLAQVFSHDEYEGSLLNTLFSNAHKDKPLEISVNGIQRDYLYIKDVVSALSKAIENQSDFGIFNLGSGSLVSLEYIAESIANVFKKKYLLDIKENRKSLTEKSLMDSGKFYTHFQWFPEFDIHDAVQDIYIDFYAGKA